MAGLDDAERHLNDALERLEAALGKRLDQAGAYQVPVGPIGDLARERDALRRDVAALGAECERLKATVRAAEEENRALREAGAAVASRLDGSISQIDRILEG